MVEEAVGAKCTVLELVTRNRMRWYGHVRRTPEERDCQKQYQYSPPGKTGSYR